MSESTLEPSPDFQPPTAGDGTATAPTNRATRLISSTEKSRDVGDTIVLEQLRLDPAQREESLGRIANYEVLDIIGRGGMGIVLRAFDASLHRLVAIKVISPALITTEHSRERFLREARAAGGINHPNVVVIHSVSEHAGLPYLVMEYVQGRSLHERIKLGGSFSEREIVEISLQVASGLAAAHRQQIIHRDIKPGNIMLDDETGLAKLTDFGLARAVFEASELTTQGGIVGTPAFMSPEQVLGETLDLRSDLFSLGCVMYAMCAGQSPFQSESPIGSATRVQGRAHMELRRACPGIPEYVSEIVDKLLEKAPSDRYQKADDLVAILNRQLLRLTHADIDPTVHWAKESTSTRRPTRWAGATAVCAVCLLALGAWFGWDNWQVQSSLSGNQSGVPASPVPVPSVPEGVLTVGQDVQAQFSSLSAAIDAATPGCTIEVLDSATYPVRLSIKAAEKLAGVTMKSSRGATLKWASSTDSVLAIEGVSNFQVKGFSFETGPAQHGIEVSGQCPGLNIVDCKFKPRQLDGENWANIHLRNGAAGRADRPILIQNCQILDARVGIVLGAAGDKIPVTWVRVEGCVINGLGRHSTSSIVVQAPVQNITISDCIVRAGLKAFGFVLPEPKLAHDVVISHNTVHDFTYFTSFENCDHRQSVRFDQNLVLETDGIYSGDVVVSEYVPWFTDNWWEMTPQMNQSFVGAIAKLRPAIPLLSRDPEHPDYLKPAVDAPKDMPGRYPTRPLKSISQSK